MNNNSSGSIYLEKSNLKANLLLGFYNFLLHFIFLLLLPLFIIAVPFTKRLKMGFFNYFGLFFPAQLSFIKNARLNGRKFYVIHGVSVGEIKLAKFVMTEILKNDINAVFALTTTAPDSFDEALKLRFENRVLPLFFPVDLPLFMSIFLNSLKPESIFIIEVDFWPNFLIAAAVRKVPVYLLNGRISNKTLKFYSALGVFSKSLLSLFSMFFMQTAADSERMIKMGAQPENVVACGNMKFDLSRVGADLEKVSFLNAAITFNFKNEYNFIITAGSTHPDEETGIMEALRDVRTQIPDFKPLLIIAPRKIARAAEICQKLSPAADIKLFSEFSGTACELKSEADVSLQADSASEKQDYGCHNDSGLPQLKSDCDNSRPAADNFSIKVLLIDKMGFLVSAYAVSDAAYVGGTLSKVDVGGHNIIEPAIFGIPLIFGPGIRNFMDCSAELKKSGIAFQVNDFNELAGKIKFLYLNHASAATADGRRKLLEIIARNSNVTEKIFLTIKESQWKDRLHSIL